MAKEASFCHVFLSFRGETRNKFTCFLYEALKAEGFVAFMDKIDIRVGDEVDITIKEGIRNSMGAIIVFSQNYAYSTWCLDELVLILKRKKNSRYFIIPIFYEVEPRDIKHQLGNYGLALEKHKARDNSKVEKWREALAQIGNILGDQVDRLQSIFIQNTVKMVREKLAANFPECRLPMPKDSVSEGYPSLSLSSRRGPINDKIILYTISNDDSSTNALVKKVLMARNIVFEERNCSTGPKYLRELEELVGIDKMRFPCVIVNGKDLCGDEGVDGLEDDVLIKRKLISLLTKNYARARFMEGIEDIRRRRSLRHDGSVQNTMSNSMYFSVSKGHQ